MVPLDSPWADDLLASVPAAARGESMSLVEADGTVLRFGDALVALLRLLPPTAPLGWLAARVPGGVVATDRLYRAMADRREALSRLVPDAAPIDHRPHGGPRAPDR